MIETIKVEEVMDLANEYMTKATEHSEEIKLSKAYIEIANRILELIPNQPEVK